MGYIDAKMVRDIGSFPHKRGSFEIENYLFGEAGSAIQQGCWVLGDTVYGDMVVGPQRWGTYTTPIMAYLAHVATVRVPSKVKHTHEVSVTEGFSTSFTSTTQLNFSLGATFFATAAWGVNTTSSVTEGISESKTRTEKMEMEGPGVFNLYQMHMVYAHSITSAGMYAPLFQYSKIIKAKGDREDLVVLSSIATDTVVPVLSSNAVAPLGWAEIQQAALMDGYDSGINAGSWVFNFRAYDLPGGQY